MNARMLVTGIGLGVMLSILLLGAGQLTGFTVAAGDRTVNLGIEVTDDTVVPLSLPQELSSITFTGAYEGSGSTNIHLVTPNATYLLGQYSAPARPGNATFLLGKGGTVIRLGPEGNLSYRHVFTDVCGETCGENLTGPYYLQVAVEEGQTDLTSLTYSSPSLIQTPSEPGNVTFNETITAPPPPVERQNIPTECSVDSDCQDEYVCHVGYCISETGHLNVTDSSGRLVALFDKHGRVLLAGGLFENSNQAPTPNAFRITNAMGDVAWITDTGDLHMKGTLREEMMSIPINGTDNFIIRNPDENVCVIQGMTGDMYTKGHVVTAVLP